MTSTASTDWRLKLLFDGLCPACAWEMRVLRRADRTGALAFEDIADPAFDPGKYGLTLPQVVGAMHAIRSDGSVMSGPDVFIEAYRLVGKRWLAAILAFPPTRPIVNLAYRAFARVRPRFSSFDPSRAPCADRCRV